MDKETRDRFEKIEDSIQERSREVDEVLDYVREKIESDREWKEFIKQLKLKVATGGVFAAMSAVGALLWWGIEHWLKTR